MKVGDIFVFEGFQITGIYKFEYEIGVRQEVIEITNDRCYSVFLDTGVKNDFGVKSLYFKHCVVLNRLVEYENGIPMMWEDEI